MQRNQIIVFAVLVIAALALTLPGAIGGANILSIDKTTINGVENTIITLTMNGADTLTGTITRSNDPNDFNTDYTLDVVLDKANNELRYNGVERRTGVVGLSQYEVVASCDNAVSCAAGAQANCNTLGGIYKEYTNFPVRVGICYKEKDYWKIADFNKAGISIEPKVDVYATVNNAQGGAVSQAYTQLSNTNANALLQEFTTSGSQVQFTGRSIGRASLVGQILQSTFPPEASGILAIRNVNAFGPGYTYYLVDTSAEDKFQNYKSEFQNICLPNARSLDALNSCITEFNSKVSALKDQAKLQSTLNLPDTVFSLNSDNIQLTVPNIYTVPAIKLEFPNTELGINRVNAVPQSASCTDKTVPGGAPSAINANIVNGQTAGTIYWTLSCTGGISVQQPYGTVQLSSGENKQLVIPITTSATAQASTCTIKAQSTDLTIEKSGVCNIEQSGVCNNVPRENFILDENCVEVCPLNPSTCPTGTTFDANNCVCTGTTPPPITCPTGQIYDANTKTCISSGSQSCQVWETSVPYYNEIAGIPYGPPIGFRCETDYILIIVGGGVLLGGIYLLSKRRRR